MTADGLALPNYIATLNNETQSIANADGTVYFAGIDPYSADTLKIYDPDKKNVGVCNIKFQQGNITTVAAVGTGGVYSVNYAKGTQDVFMDAVVDIAGNSDTLLKITQAASQPLPAGSHSQEEKPTTDPQGHDKPSEAVGDPCFNGYLINEDGDPVAGASGNDERNGC